MSPLRWLLGRGARSSAAVRGLVVLGVALCLGACDPAIFRRPAQDFTAELKTLRDGYFTQLKMRREAQYERAFSQQRQAYWAKPALALDKDTIEADQAELEQARKRGQLPANDLLVRQRAFEVLDTYAGTILALALDDDTAAIGAELAALGGDLKELAEVAKGVKVLSEAGEVAESWFPAINGVLGAVQKIAEVVSNIVRTHAIRDVIHAGHDPVKKLLALLETEVKVARKDTLFALDRAIEGVDDLMKKGIKQPADARAALEYGATLKARRDALAAAPPLSNSFAEAARLQDMLFKSATRPDAQELARQAQLLRKQVRDAKGALDALP